MDMKNSAADGVWISIKDLADLKGVSKQAISQRVKNLEAEGLIEVRQNGRFREVELVSYDRAVGQTASLSREQAAETRRGESKSSPGSALRDAQTGRAMYEARLKALDYEERIGNLVAIRGEHGLEAALIKVGEVVLRDLGSPLNRVSEIIEAARQGEPALRRFMRRIITDQRAAVATHLSEIVVGEVGPFEIDIRPPAEEES
ncbi:winged helix-turn-helix domain-containing protein [Rhizobium johnstonii]|uniref:winged helix-turn-helix domain-containing protein n=1 Tax=Rhizobium johnstonii TaxID=3019933 RepID=UPI00141005A6|nr:winged helix-turn-helix transcriptional regulator [Rhizobium leguminosarum bv. trifolii]